MKDYHKRGSMCNILFSDAILEYKLYEALKFIMLYQVTEVYEQMKTKKVIPSLFRLLFTRESSSDPLSFMMNHLNSVGDTCGLEQVIKQGRRFVCVWWRVTLATLEHIGVWGLRSVGIKPAARRWQVVIIARKWEKKRDKPPYPGLVAAFLQPWGQEPFWPFTPPLW